MTGRDDDGGESERPASSDADDATAACNSDSGTPATSLVETDEGYLVRQGELELSFSRETGALRRVANVTADLSVQVTDAGEPPVAWTVGGRERRIPPTVDIRYEGSRTLGYDLELDSIELLNRGSRTNVRTVSETDDWRLSCTYAVEGDEPRIEFAFDLTYLGDRDEVRLRRTRVAFDVPFPGSDWFLDVPGARFPPSVPVDALETGSILDWGPRRIHAGLVGLHSPAGGLATWAFSREYSTELSVTGLPIDDRESSESSNGAPEAVSIEYELWTASRLSSGEGVTFDGVWLAPFGGDWTRWLDGFQDWWDVAGVGTPCDSPNWIESAAIFEAHVGAAKFRDGFEYTPYSTVADLIGDLPRIASLGFDAVQLMPRHPHPSYVVVDEADDASAWGDPAALRRFVDVAHAVGLRVILDVVLHGVMDRDVLGRTRAAIAEHGLLGDDPDHVAQYVDDHADDWWEHLPERHRLRREHPDWFVRSDDGSVAHRYTHAFDLANPAVQSYFVDRLTDLVDRYGVDGFRLDAPTWNQFPNWDEDTDYPAGHSPLGAVELFRSLRRRLRDEHPEIALYVEAASPLFRESSDLNYNYDEMWLLDAVFGGEENRFGQPVPEEITAEEMGEWLARRNMALPRGSTTAHHVDSHDTFWWPEPGEKWLRERYGEDAAAAAIVAFAAIDGGFMNYAGAERGQEELLRRTLSLRSRVPELARGDCGFRDVECDQPSVFTAVRRTETSLSVVAVNCSDDDVSASLTVRDRDPGKESIVFDPLAEEFLAREASPGSPIDVPFDPYQPRVLVFRDAARPESI